MSHLIYSQLKGIDRSQKKFGCCMFSENFSHIQHDYYFVGEYKINLIIYGDGHIYYGNHFGGDGSMAFTISCHELENIHSFAFEDDITE